MNSLLKLGLMYTHKCNANCDSCCYECNPERSSKMCLEEAYDLIDQAAECEAFDQVGISGGEALLYEEDVIKILEYAKGFGFKTSLTTNGFWGKTVSDATEKMTFLKEKGLTELIVSTDEFHQPYVPYDYIENIFEANERVQLALKIYEVVLKDTSVHPLWVKYDQNNWIKDNCLPVGRAELSIPEGRFTYGDYSGRCHEMDMLNIMPDGTTYPCCSPAVHLKSMMLGSAFESSIVELINAKNKSMFLDIMTWRGPKWLKELGEANGCFLEKQQEEYVSKCHLCRTIVSDDAFLRKIEPYVKAELPKINFTKYLKL